MRTIQFLHDWQFDNFHYEPGDYAEVEDVAAYKLFLAGHVEYADGPPPFPEDIETLAAPPAEEAPRGRNKRDD